MSALSGVANMTLAECFAVPELKATSLRALGIADQRAVRHQLSITRFFPIGLVDMVWGKITGNAGKTLAVAFRNCLGERDIVTDLDVEVRRVAPKWTRPGPTEPGLRRH